MTNSERIQASNAEIRKSIELAESLPDAGSAVEVVLQSKTVTPSETVQEVTADAGYTALEKVMVNPIPAEYIVPSGAKSITENGEHDVKAYEKAMVNVPIPDGYIQPSGTKEITENGTHDVTEYASVAVNVAGGGETQAYGFLDNTITAIDSNVASVIDRACYGLTKLETVNIPNATSIGSNAFRGCSALTEINAPKVTDTGTYAFYACGLKSVNFPLLTPIRQNCFSSCKKLEKADFGAAEAIGQEALAYAIALRTLILRNTSKICTLTNKNALRDTRMNYDDGYIYVPAALIETYKTATNWSTYSAKFRAIEDYPDICG